ncbi:EAL domain, c-di-GMP-specific phosphodiesterase class I (or its enzymatically inactive variant) [Vogesella sp. LIG4]|nr:EAL domain, c-di-GMP-specific phosphodiesterase class I (or its enzymatically inactive variant) [Vogesella sp. LIG4]
MPCPVRLHWNEQEVFAEFDGWLLASDFFAVVCRESQQERFSHYAARLRIYGQFGQSIPAGWLFAMNYTEQKILALLKLVRVLHLLNHCGRHGTDRGLRIDLDPRICYGYSDHIVDFTGDLLTVLGLPAPLLRFQLFVDWQTLRAGQELVARYRANRHRIGLGGFGEGEHDLACLWSLEPDYLVLATRFSQRAVLYPSVREQLLALLPDLVAQGFLLGVDEISCGQMAHLARQLHARYLAGSLISEQLNQPAMPSAIAAIS